MGKGERSISINLIIKRTNLHSEVRDKRTRIASSGVLKFARAISLNYFWVFGDMPDKHSTPVRALPRLLMGAHYGSTLNSG